LREQPRAEQQARKVPTWVWGSVALTALHLFAFLMAQAPRVRPAIAPVVTPSLRIVVQATTPAPSPSPMARTPDPTPASTATPTPGKTATPTWRINLTSAPLSTRTLAPPPHTATTVHAEPTHVPAAFEGTTLGQAVTAYNATHPHKITLHVVGQDSDGVDGQMYEDLLERQWRIMGPEDFAESITKPGWPYIVIAREETLDAISAEGWGYVLDHELVHMVAAANLAANGLNLAELMRSPDGTFGHKARFHEVCADFYPRDAEGEHHPVARFYGAMDRMPELLRVLEEYDAEALAYQSPPDYEVLAITGKPLVDAACAWDHQAVEVVRGLYDEKRGPGAFDALFPSY